MKLTPLISPWLLVAALLGGGPAASATPAPDGGQTVDRAAGPLHGLASTVSEHDLDNLDVLYQPWTGDLDGIVERRLLRVLVPLSKTEYFVDAGQQRGLSYEAAVMFEQQLNENRGADELHVHLAMIPVDRDQLIAGLVAGHGDLAIGNLTVTPEREEMAAFSDPLAEGVKEVVVSGPDSPAIASVEDLSGQEVHVRPSSSYFDSLTRLNERFVAEGKAEVTLTPVSESLEDEDLMEMVNAGLLPLVVVDSPKADFWAQIFTDLVVHDDVAVATDQKIGWAFRKNSPQLAAAVNEFVATHKLGTLLGNVLEHRYLQDTKYARRALDEEGHVRLRNLADTFERYGGQYDVPWLLLAAQGYQESRLDQSLVSPAGAIGVMQLLPSTAADPSVGIPDIDDPDNNIHAGAKYLRFIFDRYFAQDAD
ncbi:MAG: lytic transglycosylase F, partial [Acidobacteriota bacterium]